MEMSLPMIGCLVLNSIILFAGVNLQHVPQREFEYQDYGTFDTQPELDRLWNDNSVEENDRETSCHRGHRSSTRRADMEELAGEYEDYPEEQITWRKRSSPYLSIGALNNLPQFFDQLKAEFENIEQQKLKEASQLAQMQNAAAAEADRNFRPPSTAAVLHAFRNYRPLRKTRSYPPTLTQG